MADYDQTAIETSLRQLHERYLTEAAEPVSFYPPEPIARAHEFGISYVSLADGNPITVGDGDVRFPLQSMSKVFTYGVALEDNGRTATLAKVGVEPSGEAYNAFRFDQVKNRPFNPMVNAGALVAAELVHGANRAEKVARVLDRIRCYAGSQDVNIDESILKYELATNDRNVGLSYLMRSLGMLDEGTDIEENLAVYLSLCAVTVTASELATMGATLANGGVNLLTEERALAPEHVRDVLTVMLTCGMYDAAGQWAYDVGMPAKSGVSGGILVAMPGRFGLGLYSPGLDAAGTSERGVAVCRELAARYGLHVFADPTQRRFATRP